MSLSAFLHIAPRWLRGLAFFTLASTAFCADSFMDRSAALLSELRSREMPAPGGAGKLPYGIAAARLADDPADQEALRYVAEAGLAGADAPFNALYRLRAFLAHPDSFSNDQYDALRESFQSVEEWNVNYTENHRVLLWSNAYLLAQAFPQGRWVWDGQSVGSSALLANARRELAAFGQEVFAKGYSDFLSPNYDLFKVAAWMNLYDFAEDPGMKAIADAMLTYHFTLLAHGSHREVILPPFSRAVGSVLDDALASNAQWIHYLFWGLGGTNAPAATNPANAEFILALTSWRPPASLEPIADQEVSDFSFYAAQPSFFVDEPLHMMRTSWFGDGYALSSGIYRMRPDQLDQPGARQLVHDNAFALAWDSSNSPRYLSAMHPYWNSGAGENNWAYPSSPFQQIVQHRNTAILLYSIPPTDPFPDAEPWAGQRTDVPLPIAQIRYPTIGLSYAEYPNDWIALSRGDVFIAIKCLQPDWSLDRRSLGNQYRAIKSRGTTGETWNTGFLIEVGTASEHGSLDAFMNTVAANPLSVDLQNLTVAYTNSQGSSIEVAYNHSLDPPDLAVPSFSINDQPVDTNAWPVLLSPWASLQNRVLSLPADDPDRSFVVDWSHPTPVLELRRNEPDPRTWAGYTVQPNGWVDTGSFMGWLFPQGDFVFVQQWQRYVFLPEDHITESGAWLYSPY